MKLIRRFLLGTILLGPSLLFADQLAVTKWKGINNNESAQIIDPSEAQDLLNIDVSHGGGSIKKRSGYGSYKALSTGKAMHGGYHFYDSSGNDVQVWGSSTSLYGIVADATPTQLVSSATLNSTWDCADSAGFAYCADSNRDAIIKTNGATISWSTTTLGTMVEVSPDRLIIAGVSGSPNTLFVSQSNTFTNFTIGVNATDAFQEVIQSPGSKITHIRWGCGRLLWWKDQSFGYFDFDNQFSAQVKTVADNIGTFDNTSAIDPGGNVWFRGQDGHIWKYDCTSIEKMSLNISSNTQASQKRVSNFWTQSSQADFQTGASSPTTAVSMTLSPGDVTISSFTAIEISSTQWTSGTSSNTVVNPSSITLTFTNTNLPSNSFEEDCGGGGAVPCDWASSTLVTNYFARTSQSIGGLSCGTSWSGQAGTYFVVTIGFQSSVSNPRLVTTIVTTSGSTLYTDTINMNGSANCAFSTRTIAVATSDIGKRVQLAFTATDDSGVTTDSVIKTTNSFILGGTVQFKYAWDSNGNPYAAIDWVTGGKSTVTAGSFTSQVYDTQFTSSTMQITGFNWTVNTSTPTFALLTATASAGPFTTLLTSSGTNAVGNRYVKYASTISISSTDTALTYISSVTLLARSTGSYYSAVHPSPNLTSWSTLGVNSANNGGAQTFYVRGSTNTYTTLSSTPTWTTITAGSLITASTGTFIQFKDDFAITAATHTPTLNDFSLNWLEGSASDQAYLIYFNDAIWASVASGAGQSTNNYIFKNDLVNDLWTIYNFGAGGMLIQGTNLYFGDTSAGNVYEFGTATSDNGTAINAYWKSKEFTGSDPFLQNQLTQIDSFAKKNQGTTLTATYTVDSSTATSYTMSLSTSSSIAESRKLLPAGKNAYIWNIQYGDNSTSSSWELFGYRISFTPNAYRPTQ